MSDDDDRVYYVGTCHQVFHLSLDCPRLADHRAREPVVTTRADAEGLGKTACKFCSPDLDVNRSVPQSTLAARLEAADPEEVAR